MSFSNFVPELWSSLINQLLQANLVYASCVNRNWEGEIKSKGDRVKINEIGDISVENYTPYSTTITYEELADASQMLEITESKYFAFKVESAEKIQSNVELLKPAISKAVYALKSTVDTYLAGMHANAGITANLGTDTTAIDVNSSNVAEYIIKMGRLLDENDVVRDNQRFLIAPPWFIEKLVLADIVKSTDNVQTARNGFITHYSGFNIHMSNNVPNTAGAFYKIVAGHPVSTTFASQAGEIEKIRLEGSFSDAVRGMLLYGMQTTHPDALATLTATAAAEAV